MRKIIFFICFCFFFSCQKGNNEDREIVGHFPIPYVKFSIMDKEGNDLLNPTNPNSYKHYNIALYTDSLTTKKRCENRNIEYHTYDNNPERWYICFMAYCDSKKIRPEFNDTLYCATNYLKLNDTTVDVVYSEYIINGYVKALYTILYNGEDIFHTGGYAVK